MMDHRKLKVGAATMAVAVVGAGAALAATHGSSGSSGATATSTTRTGNAPPGPPRGGPGGGFDTDLVAAASYLGTTKAKLQTQLRSGKTLAQIAKATGGKSVSGLITAIVSAETKQIQAAKAAGKLTAAQAKQMLSGLTQRVTDFVNGKRPTGPPPGGSGGAPPRP